MKLQAVLVILAALGVNGLPALAPKALQERDGPQPVLSTVGCVIANLGCTPPEEAGKARRQENARWNKLLRPSQPTQKPPTMKRQRNTEGIWPPTRPNTPREEPPATKINNKIGTAILQAKPTNGSTPLGRRSAQPTPLEKPDRPTQPGQTSSCNGWANIEAGDTCDTVTLKFNINREQFLEWNPAVSKNCDKEIGAKFSYCVSILGSERAKRTEPFFTFTIPTPAMPTIPTPEMPSITPPFGNGIQARQEERVPDVHPVTVGPDGVLTVGADGARQEESVPPVHPVSVTPDGILIDPAPAPERGTDGVLPKLIRARATQSANPFPVLSLPYEQETQAPKVGDKNEKRNEVPELTRRQVECAMYMMAGP
ncbi:hypothetical protein EMPG_11507 [Blastomyces silverae]|uniref:LysM domain-containing protein n=1 Tax=Blastomyces silverae TaxID=2060906 RepID=A0A0H1BPT3_9EURO|nr:hypothetical protein EMPG_11507 [Blastomyces silverae]